MPLSRPIKMSNLNSAVFVTPSTSTVNMDGRPSRIYARSYTFGSTLKMSAYETGTTERNWGYTVTLRWIRGGDNLNYGGGPAFTLSTDLTTVNPLMQAGDRFSVVVGSVGGWTNEALQVQEFYYTYGTALNNPVVNLNFGFRKSNWLVSSYNGANTFSCYTYYSGDDTDSPQNRIYHLSHRWWGTGGLAAGTIVNRNSTVDAYVAANPLNV